MAEAATDRKLKAVFMGTPGFAAVILDTVLQSDIVDVIAVYTQPDRPAGRGRKLRQSDVKKLALSRSIPVFQPETFKEEDALEDFAALSSDVALVAAYGLILPQSILDIPKYGCINVHASLLPKLRGAAPIQRAIMNGDNITGVTIMQMNAGMDTGDILLQRSLGIDINDTAADLHDQLAEMGGRFLVEALSKLHGDNLVAIPQNEAHATYAPKLTKEEGRISFDTTAKRVHAHIRGVSPWPGAFFETVYTSDGNPQRLSLCPGTIGGPVPEGVAPGTIVGLEEDHLAIACTDALYLVPQVCPQCKSFMDARSFFNGYTCRLPEH